MMENYVIKPDWKFKRVLKENKLQVQELAKLTGMHRNFISLYSGGRYNLDSLEKRRIAKILNLPEDEIFERREVFSIK
jgi:transcriptional regulator with XRE-family HTH domain